MKGMLVFGIIAAFIGIILVMEIYPMLENPIMLSGAQIGNATGYSSTSAEATSAKASLWAVFPVIVILALFVDVLTKGES